MNIRRRLFFSNLLMIVVPVVACGLISYGILFVFTGRSESSLEKAFPRAFQIFSRFQVSDDREEFLRHVEDFNSHFTAQKVFIAVVSDGEFLYPPNTEEVLASHEHIFPLLLEDGVTGSLSTNELRVIMEQKGQYRIFFIDMEYKLVDSQVLNRPMFFQVLIIFGGLIAIVLITSRVLTFLLTRSITVPLGMLVDGVHQLRDGNLSYRIEYKGKDEFAPVCDDFNEMAQYLQHMIDRQQRDEQSRKELLAGISHDLRTPLTSIKAYVEGLLDGVAVDLPTQLRYLKTIRQKAEDIDQLVDKLFLFSKLEMEEYPFQFERLDLATEIRQLVASNADEYRKRGLSVIVDALPVGVAIRTDPVQLNSALLNILENSALYKTKDQGSARIGCTVLERTVEIAVTDDGPGVPAESLSKLFDVFYRSDPSRQNPSKGSGLGLAITRRVIERMGGAIRAESPPAGGLSVIITLPREWGYEEDSHH